LVTSAGFAENVFMGEFREKGKGARRAEQRSFLVASCTRVNGEKGQILLLNQYV
jgi:hypothetical protein